MRLCCRPGNRRARASPPRGPRSQASMRNANSQARYPRSPGAARRRFRPGSFRPSSCPKEIVIANRRNRRVVRRPRAVLAEGHIALTCHHCSSQLSFPRKLGIQGQGGNEPSLDRKPPRGWREKWFHLSATGSNASRLAGEAVRSDKAKPSSTAASAVGSPSAGAQPRRSHLGIQIATRSTSSSVTSSARLS